MAATPISLLNSETKAGVAFEDFSVTNGGGDTTFTITPTYIKAITSVQITAGNAAAIGTGYVTSFVPGAATVVVTGVNSAIYFVQIEGIIA